MQKIKNRILDRMAKAHLTKAEVDFILEISHYQDDYGKVYGVYYRKICAAINISYQTFYVTMASLCDKGLIRLEKAHYGDWDIVIQDNDFSYKGAMEEGYVSTGHDIFYNSKFREMKANEKLLAMMLMRSCGNNRKCFMSVERFYENYCRMFQVTVRTLREYLGRLRKYFSFHIRNKSYVIVPMSEIYKDTSPTDLQNMQSHLGQVVCRRDHLV